MPAPLANCFVHLDIRVDPDDWCAWAAGAGIAPQVLFFIQMRPELLYDFQPDSADNAFPTPRSWEFISNIVNRQADLDPGIERSLFRGTVGEGAAVDFAAFLKVWRELPHPRAVIDDPKNAKIPDNDSALIALCGSLYRMATDVNLDSIVTYALRLRREVGEFLVGSCKGRYGTDFRPGFARLAELNIRPAVCLYFTDMDCSDYPDAPPNFPVVWVNYGPPPSDENREPWGERIDIAA